MNKAKWLKGFIRPNFAIFIYLLIIESFYGITKYYEENPIKLNACMQYCLKINHYIFVRLEICSELI